MNNNIEVIGIDHGWSQMKTSNTCCGRFGNRSNAYDKHMFCRRYRYNSGNTAT